MHWRFGKEQQPEADQTHDIMVRRHKDGMIAFPMGEGTATPELVAQLGENFGVTFPSAFVAHICGKFPGIYVEVKKEVWPEAKEFDVGPFWTFLRGFYTFSPLSMSEDWMRLDYRTRALQEQTGLVIAPVLKRIGDPNVVCVDSHGALQELDNSTYELTPLDGDFWAVLDREWRELAERKNKFVLEHSKETK
jgi:hypothetical protein